MNQPILTSFGSMLKGAAYIADVIKGAIERLGNDPTEDQVLAAVSESLFAINFNKQSGNLLRMYLIQLHGNQLFVEDEFVSFDLCMTRAHRDVNLFLSFNNLDTLAKFIWINRVKFLDIWKSLAHGGEPSGADIAAAFDQSFDLLKAA